MWPFQNYCGQFCYVRHGSVELTADEKAEVLQQLPTGVSHTEVDAVLAVLGQILTGSTTTNEEDIGEQDQVCGLCVQYTACLQCRFQFGVWFLVLYMSRAARKSWNLEHCE